MPQNETSLCHDVFRDGATIRGVHGGDLDLFKVGHCPECLGKLVVHYLKRVKRDDGVGLPPEQVREEYVGIVFPRKHAHKTVSPEVPKEFTQDYDEACLVFDDSAKASAALSRRLLQRIFHEHYKIKERDLLTEIQTFLSAYKPPSYLSDPLDAVRTVGNFAAHPIKNTHTGAIVDVEPGESEWLIELLDTLFDFAFVQPERQKQRTAALNAKLAAAGKPIMAVSPLAAGP
jgi:hypothetical protein